MHTRNNNQTIVLLSSPLLHCLCVQFRPDTVNSFDWFSEKQAKIYRFIRKYLQSNGTEDDPKAVNMSRVMYEACMDTSK